MADEVEELYPTLNLAFVTGDTVRRRLQFTDPDPNSPDPENPVMIPRVLTGYTGRAQARKGTKPADSLIAEFEVTGFTEDGFVYLHLPPAESAKVLRETGWDLEFTDPSGDVETVMGGLLLPKGDYTK